jgi:hypothetical protein
MPVTIGVPDVLSFLPSTTGIAADSKALAGEERKEAMTTSVVSCMVCIALAPS